MHFFLKKYISHLKFGMMKNIATAQTTPNDPTTMKGSLKPPREYSHEPMAGPWISLWKKGCFCLYSFQY